MSTTAAEPLPDHFMGFRRGDGRVGVRNHLLVLSTVALTARLAERASEAYRVRSASTGNTAAAFRAPTQLCKAGCSNGWSPIRMWARPWC